MTLTHVHIVPNGERYNLRTGLFKAFAGWQTAEAAGLDVQTRDAHGKPITHCLDSLTLEDAQRLAVKLDAWLTKLEEPKAKSRKSARLDEMSEKYRKAMEGE